MTGIAAQAQVTFEQSPFTYKQIAKNKVEVTSASTKTPSGALIANLDVPSTVEHDGVTYTVTAIGESAFKWKTAASVTLPETIDTLRANAFNTFDVPSITLPQSLRFIGDYAFSGCKFTSIVVPENVDSIGRGAFFTCKNLTSITLPTNLKRLGQSVFYNCALTSITLPKGLTEIPYSAFQSCTKLESVDIRSDIKTVGKMAFLKCSALTSINLPSSVDSIGYEAFCNTGLTTFTLPKSVRAIDSEFIANAPITSFAIEDGNTHFAIYDGAIYSADKRILYAAPVKGITSFRVQDGCLGIYGGAFSQCEATEVTLPESVIALDGFAFCEAKLEKINLPAGIKLIGEQCFAGTNLTDVTIPSGSSVIYEAAFALCPKLKTVTIPASITDIAIRAFLNCTALESVTCLGETAPALEEAYESYEEQFYGVPSSCKLIVPAGATQSYKDAGWNSWFTITEAEPVAPTELTVVSTKPANGAVVTDKYVDMSFDIEFDEDFTIVKSTPAAVLRSGDSQTGRAIEPDDAWNALRSKAKTLTVWGSDYDGFVCTFTSTADTDYFFTLPAGVVKGKDSGLANGEIVIAFTTRNTLGIDSVDGTEATVTGIYDLSGRKLTGTGIRGIVIKKLSNGKTVKVLNK